jgi:hypothetical protein
MIKPAAQKPTSTRRIAQSAPSKTSGWISDATQATAAKAAKERTGPTRRTTRVADSEPITKPRL